MRNQLQLSEVTEAMDRGKNYLEVQVDLYELEDLFCISTDINPKKRENWQKAYNWLLDKAIIYKEIASIFGK